MYFDFHSFFRIAYLSFSKGKNTPAPLTFKRFFFLGGFFTIFPIVELFNAICCLLDEFLFPGYRKIELKKPVFIVGNPRSGTTLLHRIMARDEEQFFCFRTWEIVFPAIIQKKVISFIGRIDRMAGGIFRCCLQRLESRFFRNLNKMHPTGMFYPEEDGKLLVHIFSCPDLIWLFPFFEAFRWFDYFDEAASPQTRRRIMTFYKNCLKRQAYFKGRRKNLLSKNPLFSPKIDSLYEYFPGCRIIYMARNPLDVIPSMQSLAYTLWHSIVNMEADYPYQNKVWEVAKCFYDYPLARLERSPRDSYTLVKYEDLVQLPNQVVQQIYRRFGFDLTPSFLQALKEEEGKAKSYESSHVYSLDRFYLTRKQIVSELQHIFHRFGFDPREEHEEKA